ncbi:hypothetical protein L226DRAFT_383469 [Lentinus tigrinus ALCF2SS1-7]|uniref:uncharacterized protein n=1 Tax=Lentinus tigrinus ALCF2SS1-7 TaxID=1328758 RepID=UPI001165F574|nr:hypothetical protein L226DRAFT_383469 [Lentinus tigrinus ALCF2SS1-7]
MDSHSHLFVPSSVLPPSLVSSRLSFVRPLYICLSRRSVALTDKLTAACYLLPVPCVLHPAYTSTWFSQVLKFWIGLCSLPAPPRPPPHPCDQPDLIAKAPVPLPKYPFKVIVSPSLLPYARSTVPVYAHIPRFRCFRPGHASLLASSSVCVRSETSGLQYFLEIE